MRSIVPLSLAFGLTIALGACSKSTTTPTATATSTEAQDVGSAGSAFNSTGTSSTGVLSGTGSSSASIFTSVHPESIPTEFDPSNICSHSGDVNPTLFPTNSTPGWAISRIYCNFTMRPDGPDTVRGGIDRTYGFLCALGSLTYDGQSHTIPFTITSSCFSPAFLAIACNGASSCSYKAIATAYTAAQFSAAGYTAPAGFNKIVSLQVSDNNGDSLYNTVAIMDSSSSELAVAVNYDLPGAQPSASNSVLAVYMNSSTGVLRYEGRFAGNTDYVYRHLRAQIGATFGSGFSVSAIGNIQFLEVDNFASTTQSAFYLSMLGTPTAGREIGYAQNTYTGTYPSGSWGSWSTANENGTCYPTQAGCAAGTLALTDTTFMTESTLPDAWFANDSLLQNVNSTVPTTDIWN